MGKLAGYILLFLTLTFMLGTTVFASDIGGNGTGNEVGGDTTINMSGKDGASIAKTGFLIYVVDGATNQTVSPVLFHTTKANPVWKTTNARLNDTGLRSRFGMSPTDLTTSEDIIWGMAPWSGSGSHTGIGNGAKIKQWLLAPQNGYQSGALYVLTNYLGYTEAQCAEFASGDYYLVLEGVSWHGVYNGGTHTGEVFVGTAKNWAEKTTQQNSYVGRYTHEFLPLSMYWESGLDWLGIPAPTQTSGRLSSDQIISSAYGIIAVRSSEVGGEKDIVKVYKTGEVVDKTTYGKCSDTVIINEDSGYTPVQWETSNVPCLTTSNPADWLEVTSNSSKTQSGTGGGTVITTPIEKVVYVLYEKNEEIEVPEQNNDSIQAWELDFVFPNLSGKRNGGGIDIASFKLSDFWGERGSHNWSGSEMTVQENIGGSLTGFNGSKLHLYRSANGLYTPWGDSKVFSDATEVFPHYAYISTRAAWGDVMNMCTYRAGADDKSFAKDTLKMTEGNGVSKGVSYVVNQEGTLADVLSDSYSFVGVGNESWEDWEVVGTESYTREDGSTGHRDIHDWVGKNADRSTNTISYTVNHYCDKYKVKDLGTAVNPKAGTIALDVPANSLKGEATIKQVLSTQYGNMSVIPEVEMTMWYNSGNTYNPSKRQTFVMGEKKRSAKPAQLHGYIAENNPRGGTSSPSASTGTRADELLEKWSNSFENFVASQGSTFETAVTTSPKLYIKSFALDVVDSKNGSGVRSDWGNSGYTPQASHDAYVSTLVDSVSVDLLMQYYQYGGGAVSDVYTLLADTSTTRVGDTSVSEIPITFKDGQIQNKSEIIARIKSEFGVDDSKANQTYENWGLDAQLNSMFVSNSDGDNNSSAQSDFDGKKWYDEESITMCIKIFVTEASFGKTIGDDKIDYNMLSMQTKKTLTNGTEAIEARIYQRMYFNTRSFSVDGYSFYEKNETIRTDEVNKARFLISNTTTNNMNK